MATRTMVGLTLVITFAGAVRGDEPAARKLLDRRTGTWTTTATMKKAEWTPEETTVTGVETIEWILDGKVQKGASKNERGVENIWLTHYDPEADVYRLWYFDSAGSFPRGESLGRRKGDDTIEWTMDMGDGVRAKANWTFHGDDRLEWSLIARNAEGTVMLDMSGSTARKKE